MNSYNVKIVLTDGPYLYPFKFTIKYQSKCQLETDLYNKFDKLGLSVYELLSIEEL